MPGIDNHCCQACRIPRDYLAPFGGPSPRPGENVTVRAAHCTTPQLAAGGATCLGDALVHGEELASSVPTGLQAYSHCRFDRCRCVVETSVQLSAWQILPETPDEQQRQLFGEAVGVLADLY
jgi:hypothetical protein